MHGAPSPASDHVPVAGEPERAELDQAKAINALLCPADFRQCSTQGRSKRTIPVSHTIQVQGYISGACWR
jgi:hypothetical protein